MDDYQKGEKRMKISTKFGAMMFGIILCTVLLTFNTINGLNQISSVNKEQQDNNSPLMLQSLSFQIDIIQIQQWLTDISATRAATGLDDGFSEAELHYQNAKAKLETLKELGAEDSTVDDINKNLDEYYKMGIEMANAYIQEGTEAGNVFMKTFDPYAKEMQDSVDVLLKEADRNYINGNAQIVNKIKGLYHSSILVFTLILFIVMCAYSIINKTVIKRLASTTELVKQISDGEGDLTQRLIATSKDEIGSMSVFFNKFIQTVQNIVFDVRKTAFHISNASTKLANSSQQSIITAEEIAKTINEIAERMSEQAEITVNGSEKLTNLGDLIENSKEHIYLTTKSSNEVNELAKLGMLNMDNLAQIIYEIGEATKQVKVNIVRTKQSSEQISEANNLIATIAKRTNLIALNASIEAANAGVYGTSFQVVAKEIKKLAEQTTASAKIIEDMVKTLQEDANHTEVAIGNVELTFDTLSENANSTRKQYMEILESINHSNMNVEATNKLINQIEIMKKEVLLIMKELSTMAIENAAGTQEISTSIQEQTASFELIAKSSTDLTQLFQVLQDKIERFKVE